MSWTFPDIISSTRAFLDLVTPIAIGCLPIFLHLVDKALERFSPFREEVIRKLMSEDRREAIAAVGKSPAVFEGVGTYFKFEHMLHLVIGLAVFNILSLYVAQTECTGDMLHATAPTLIGIIALIIFVVLFLLKIVNRGFDPAASLKTPPPVAAGAPTIPVNPLRNWQKASFIALALVLAMDTVLHFTCG